ncbi:acetyl-CoA acetyltransferase [Actinoplanes sp. NPDC049596]|uniref:acetyl-CoA acetyltransferase n=1 Tax=unclassified Actinoplanes TaxID=2626549 RepID=UPI00341B56A5
MPLPDSTPVIVGVGEVSERFDAPGYLGRSPVELAADAARLALSDAEIAASEIDTIAAVRQFEISLPFAQAPLGRSDNFPRSVAGRIGAAPYRAVLEVGGGQSPQHLVNEFAAAIAAGDARVVLLTGAEAISTISRLAGAPDAPDFTEHAPGSLEDRGFGLEGIVSMDHFPYGLTDTPSHYALFENARRARLGLSRKAYAGAMGALFAPFTRIAASNPHAAAPVARTAAELVTVTAANRPIADPYTRYIVARDKVNQGAAVLMMSLAAARRLGVPKEKWTFLAGHADLRERDLLDRADLSAGPAAVAATRHALDLAGLDLPDLATLDLYSCFAVPVFAITDAFGLSPDDPRGLTVTGGLPFFGGAGNNYSMHAIATTVTRARAIPGTYGFVGANGGMMSKYSTGVYTTAPVAWKPDDSPKLQASLDAHPAPGQASSPSGPAVIETYTVKHDRDGTRTGIVIARLESDGRRFLAHGNDILELLSEAPEPIGTRVTARHDSDGNHVEG